MFEVSAVMFEVALAGSVLRLSADSADEAIRYFKQAHSMLKSERWFKVTDLESGSIVFLQDPDHLAAGRQPSLDWSFAQHTPPAASLT